MYLYFKRVVVVGIGNYIYFWKSKRLSDENTTSDHKSSSHLSYYGTKTRVELRGSYLKQDKITFNHKKVVNIYIVYELDKIYVKTSSMLVNCLFGAVRLTKNSDIDNKYSVYGIGFDRRGAYLLPRGNFGRYKLLIIIRGKTF